MAAGRAEDEAVLEAARRVLEAQGAVPTLHRFLALVRKELSRSGDADAVGPVRLRRLMAAAGFARMRIKTRKGPKERVLNRCPVCRSPLRQVRNQTLFGGEVTLVLRCTLCPYRTGKEKRIPVLYSFHLKEGRGQASDGVAEG